MVDQNDSESPLEQASGAAGPRTTEAFSALGNETRLSILLALWEAFEPLTEDNAVSFSELRERVGTRDSGKFNYHLDKLTDNFVRASEAGYELRESGQKLVRTVIAGTGIGETTVSPTELELSCHHCGYAPVEVSYRDEMLYLTCQGCDGFVTFEEFPSGTLAVWDLDPAGLAHRGPSDLLLAGAVAENNRLRMMREGVCPDCSGAIQTSLHTCEEHVSNAGEVCPRCGTRDSARVRYLCTVCKNWNEGPAQIVVHDHPAVISFYYDHGINVQYDTDDTERFYRVWELLWQQEHALTSIDPVHIEVTVPCDGDELHLRLDADLNVIAIDESNASITETRPP